MSVITYIVIFIAFIPLLIPVLIILSGLFKGDNFGGMGGGD